MISEDRIEATINYVATLAEEGNLPLETALFHRWNESHRTEAQCHVARGLFSVDVFRERHPDDWDTLLGLYADVEYGNGNVTNDCEIIDESLVPEWIQKQLDTDNCWFHYATGVYDGITWSLWGHDYDEFPQLLLMQEVKGGNADACMEASYAFTG